MNNTTTAAAFGEANATATNLHSTFSPAPMPPPSASATPTEATDWVGVHGDYLFNFAVGQVRDAGLAEDLVQETFLAALRAQDRFAGKSSERTWLVGILRHKIYDHLRHACRERAVRAEVPTGFADEEAWENAVMWLHDVAAECQSPCRRLELAEFRENLESALGKLPPRVAQVFQLYEMEERPNAEVCRQLNISESNLWVMLHRARRQLREHLRGWWKGDNESGRTRLMQL
jgi:RNA polymerase sigma-70 factor (ECF subfamily)